jgi:two-component system sensor histidine kinase AlgZ
MSPSINQNNITDALPNFRNLGVVLRIVIIVNGISLFVAVTQAGSVENLWQRIIYGSAFLQPVLLSCLLLLYTLNDTLARQTYRRGMVGVMFVVVFISWAIARMGGELFSAAGEYGVFHTWQLIALSMTVAALTLAYFRMRAQSLSPALADARLQALQARIRPHFLFNSINAVLGIVRSNPKRAESALEDMADLFRMAMGDNRELATIKHEVALSRQYLALESLRLGDRLKINWQLQAMPQDALIPPLILQPLLENAVYHGIEPMHEGGEITIKINLSGKELHLDVYNPFQPHQSRHDGNKLALANIRERLSLLFDVEASYSVDAGEHYYRVHIIIPYVREEFQ